VVEPFGALGRDDVLAVEVEELVELSGLDEGLAMRQHGLLDECAVPKWKKTISKRARWRKAVKASKDS